MDENTTPGMPQVGDGWIIGPGDLRFVGAQAVEVSQGNKDLPLVWEMSFAFEVMGEVRRQHG